MADYHADAAIVFSAAGLGVVERSLKDSGREHDFIVEGIVVGIDGLRSHAPFRAVYRLAPFSESLFLAPDVCVVNILPIRQGGVDFKI